MRRRLANITEHDTGARLRVRNRDEVASLAEAMNGLLDRLQRALARQRGFVADAGHELRTPLTALKRSWNSPPAGAGPETLNNAISAPRPTPSELIRLAEDLLLLAARRRREIPASAADRPFRSGGGLSAKLSGRCSHPHDLDELDADPTMRIVGDPDRLRQVVGNLLDNALRHALRAAR